MLRVAVQNRFSRVFRLNRMCARLNTARKWLSEGNENQTGLCSPARKRKTVSKTEQIGRRKSRCMFLYRIYSNETVFFKGESFFLSFLLNFCSDVWLWRINSPSWMWTMRNDYFFALYRHTAWKIHFKANRTFKFPEKGLKNIDRISWFEEIETKPSVIMQRNFLFNSFMRVMV